MLLVRANERAKSDKTHAVRACAEIWRLTLFLMSEPWGQSFSTWASPATIQLPILAEFVSRSVCWAAQDQACCCPNTWRRLTTHSVFGAAPGPFPDHTTWALIVRRNGSRFLPEAQTRPCFQGIPLICWRFGFGRCLKPTLISLREAP